MGGDRVDTFRAWWGAPSPMARALSKLHGGRESEHALGRTNNYIIIDRSAGSSHTAELLVEFALRQTEAWRQ